MSEFVVNGFVVPPSQAGANEICHHFVYLYLRASGSLGAGAPALATLNGDEAFKQVLFPHGTGGAARANGNIAVTAGSIVGFWTQGNKLQHSMVAVAPDIWVGANNTGCFGTPGGRVFVKDIGGRASGQGSHFGWVGAGHQWQGQYQQLDITFAAPPHA